jgi:hypothetical protein
MQYNYTVFTHHIQNQAHLHKTLPSRSSMGEVTVPLKRSLSTGGPDFKQGQEGSQEWLLIGKKPMANMSFGEGEIYED